jgi:phosphoribosyl 1,2-cyclic phosphate phosphodiesterase
MQILLLGTGGSDGIPAFYGDDRVSEYARKHGGKDRRSRAAALVDGTLKLDLGPDTLSQMNQHGLDARDWTALFVTHSDEDHLCLSEIQYGLFPFVECEHLGFPIYGNSTVQAKIRERYPLWPMDVIKLEKYKPVSHEGFMITPIHATHKDDEECHNFIIEKEGKSFLYATDTGVYREEVFDFLAGKNIDCLVIECSDGKHKTPYIGHMDIAQCVETVQRLRQSRALSTTAQVFTTHHTAGGDATHQELIDVLKPYDIKPGFDGMTIKI